MLIDYKKRINALIKIPVDPKTKNVSKDYFKELDKFVKMAEFNQITSLSSKNTRTKLSSSQSQLKELANEHPRLKDFFRKAASL